jgi:glycosidase
MSLTNQVQLITYADSLGSNLKELKTALNTDLKDLFGGVHILPFYPSSGDRGFAPLTHLEVEPRLGEWDDIRQISQKYEVCADIILNHISKESEFFQDFLARGKNSPY